MPLLDQDLPARAQQGGRERACRTDRSHDAGHPQGCGGMHCPRPRIFDDAVQEGLIGLFHAVRGFDPAAGQTFTAYAAACIRHAQQDARRAALRKKHAPLNYSVPLPAAEESTDTHPGPEELAIFGEQYADTLRRMQTELSALERTVLMAGLEGRTPRADRAGAGTSRQKRGQCAGPCAPQAARCAHNLGFRRFACVIYQPAPSSA